MVNNRCTQSGKVTVRSGSDCWKPATAPSSNGGVHDLCCEWRSAQFPHLFFPGKPHSQCERSSLSARKCPEIGGLDLVHYGIWILPLKNIYRFNARCPQITVKSKFFLEPQIQARVRGEAHRVRRTDQSLLQIDGAEGVAGSVLEKIAQLYAPDVCWVPAPGQQAIGRIPGHRSWLLRRIEDRTLRGIQHLVRAGTRPCVCGVHFGGLREDMARRYRGRAVAVLAMILEEKNSSGLRGLLVDVGKLVISVSRQELKADQGVVSDFLLPASAGAGEARFVESAGGQPELADDGRGKDRHSRTVVKRIELALVQRLANQRKIERGVVDSPSKRELRAVVAEWEGIA